MGYKKIHLLYQAKLGIIYNMKIEIPSNCPSCSHILERVKNQLFCKNTNCEAQSSKRVINFCNKSRIKGFGEKTLEKLQIKDIPSLYELTEKELVDILGEKMGTKLSAELEASRKMNLATFISALSIPLIGRSAADKLVTIITSIEDISQKTCKDAGLGDKATASLLRWKLDEYPNYSKVSLTLYTDIPINTQSSIDITVCCTGKIEGHTRNSLQDFLNSIGVKVTSSVSTKTNYLVCEELKGSSKEKKAESLKIEIISLTELLNRIK